MVANERVRRPGLRRSIDVENPQGDPEPSGQAATVADRERHAVRTPLGEHDRDVAGSNWPGAHPHRYRVTSEDGTSLYRVHCPFRHEGASISVISDQPPSRWVTVARGVRVRSMVEGDGVAVVLYRIAPGTRFVPHTHDFVELGVVVSGKGQFFYEGTPRNVRGGDSFYIPAGGSHGFQVPEGGGSVVTMNVSAGVSERASGPSAAEILHLAKSWVEPLSAAVSRRR